MENRTEMKGEMSERFFPVSTLVIVLALAGGVLLYERPLQSSRPSAQKQFRRSLEALEDVEARLWEDPISAVHIENDRPRTSRAAAGPRDSYGTDQRDRGDTGSDLHDQTTIDHLKAYMASGINGKLRSAVDSILKEGGNYAQPEKSLSLLEMNPDREEQIQQIKGEHGLSLILVMVPGSANALDAEVRRRSRHAVVSALAEKGYIPEHSERLGYFNMYWRHITLDEHTLVTERRTLDASFQAFNNKLWRYFSKPDDGSTPNAPAVSGGSLKPKYLSEPQKHSLNEPRVLVPFERFKRDAMRESSRLGPNQDVVVLWLDDAAFQSHFFLAVNQLVNDLLVERASQCDLLLERLRDKKSNGTDRIDSSRDKWQEFFWALTSVQVLGPANSEGLRSLVREKARYLLDKKRDLLDKKREIGSYSRKHGDQTAESDVNPVDSLLEIVGDYLDAGLTEEQHEGARKILLNDVNKLLLTDVASNKNSKDTTVAAILKEAFAGVSDSDSNWKITVSQYFLEWCDEVRPALGKIQIESADTGDLDSSGRDTDTKGSLSIPKLEVDHLIRILERYLSEAAGDSSVDHINNRNQELVNRTRELVKDEDLDYYVEALRETFEKWHECHSGQAATGNSWRDMHNTAVILQAQLKEIQRVLRRSLVRFEDSDLEWDSTVVTAWFNSILHSFNPSNKFEDRWLYPFDYDFQFGLSTLENLKVFSGQATASGESIMSEVEDSISEDYSGKSLEDVIKKRNGVDFIRTSVTDDRLASSLKEELKRRGVDLTDPAQHVALIGEWDTFYGRALRDAIEEVIESKKSDGGKETFTVHRYSYLRGIDGYRPGYNGFAEGEIEDADDPSQRFARSALEKPFGPSQLDYIRRLASELRILESNLRASGAGSIRAIGVTGSDVYDSQLILQALREVFPNAIFFTTHLDARLFHPSQYYWSHNLIVASSFGLKLRRELQGVTPPFRDSYQTAMFFSCLMALGGVTNDVATTKKSESFARGEVDGLALRPTNVNLAEQLKPQLFEVSRSGAYDITPVENVTEIHPQRRELKLGMTTAIWLIFLLICGSLCVYLAKSQDPDSRERKIEERFKMKERLGRFSWFFWPSAGGLVISLIAIVWLDEIIYKGGGEPFELFEGISIWPTEFGRLAVMLISIYLIRITFHRLAWNERIIEADFVLEKAGTPQFRLRDLWCQELDRTRRLDSSENRGGVIRFWKDYVVAYGRSTFAVYRKISTNSPLVEETDEKKASAESIWSAYRQKGTYSQRFGRVLPIGFFYLLFCFILSVLAGETRAPYRSSIAYLTDECLIYSSYLFLTILAFYVTDATRLCEHFIRSVSKGDLEWGAHARKLQLGGRRLVNKSDADSYITIKLIAERTKAVGPLVMFPLAVISILLLSRISYFDNWRWPVSFVLILVTSIFYVLTRAVRLRSAAEQARGEVIETLQTRLTAAYAASRGSRASQLELILKEVKDIKEGAFASWGENPVVRALVLPFGGFGAVAILDYLATLGI